MRDRDETFGIKPDKEATSIVHKQKTHASTEPKKPFVTILFAIVKWFISVFDTSCNDLKRMKRFD